MKNLVSFEKVSKRFKKTQALNEMTFALPEKSCTALVGNNGCGKSTTIYVLCNILPYDSGEARFDGRKITPNYQSYKRRLGMILERPYFIEEFTVRAYWRFVAKYQMVPKDLAEERIQDLLGLLSLSPEKDKAIKELSSGARMKVTLGSALIHNPEMLVLDEPFLNLDVRTSEMLMHLLQSLKGQKTIFIASHNLQLVADLCDTFLIMDHGKIIANFRKDDFSNLSELRENIKARLTSGRENYELSWLS